MPEPRTVRIVVADDHPIFRAGLRKLLEAEPEYTIVGEAADGEQAVELVRTLQPDLLLLDVLMPRMTGLDTLRELAASGVTGRTVLLTAGIERAEIITALQLGARGVLLKDAATQLLSRCLRKVMAGEFWVGRDSVADLVQMLKDMAQEGGPGAAAGGAGLTARELQIVDEIVQGATNKHIAEKFQLSEQTVKNHLSNIFDKVGVSTRLELALYAVNHRLVPSARP